MPDEPRSAASLDALSSNERRLLGALLDGKTHALEAAARSAGLDAVHARSAASWLESKGFVETEEDRSTRIRASEEARRYAAQGMPERRLWSAVHAAGGRMDLDRARVASDLTEEEFAIAMAWWGRKGLGRIEKSGEGGRTLVADPDPRPTADEEALSALAATDGVAPETLEAEGLRMLRSRKGLVEEETVKRSRLRLKPGVHVPAEALASSEDSVEAVTPELLKSGAWRDRTIRPFDVAGQAPRAMGGKPHPLQQIIQEVREIFLEMGFEEIEYDFVQSSFWNMDALFIPQDHPAREMQDTFYLDHPSQVPVPKTLVTRVAKVHTTGGSTGSRGWGGTYDRAEAVRPLLRTHTTVGTIRHLAAHPDRPCRVFSVGRVFRKETMDATHLPEFHQVEGIATEPGANFRQLLGILKAFYSRLGFEKLRWRPAYFPYTEPSMEVEVYTNGRWMELGGSGIFRPEVTLPLGVRSPVLAWGLGLERLAMLRLGLSDIRQLYLSDLEWLRTQPLL